MNTRGYTLIEVIIVVTLLGFLVTAIGFGSINYLRRGRNAKRQADLEIIKSQLELYKVNSPYEVYPPNYPALEGALIPIYLKSLPTDPATGDPYIYNALPNACDNAQTSCSSYELIALLESDDYGVPQGTELYLVNPLTSTIVTPTPPGGVIGGSSPTPTTSLGPQSTNTPTPSPTSSIIKVNTPTPTPPNEDA